MSSEVYIPIDDAELEEFKRNKLFDEEFWKILKEITIFTIFLVFLFFVSYSNVSNSSFRFNQLYQSAFVNAQNTQEIGLSSVN